MEINTEEKIKLLQKEILQQEPTLPDNVVDLLELLFKRIDELLETIEQLRDQIYAEDKDDWRYQEEQQVEDDRYHYDRNDLD